MGFLINFFNIPAPPSINFNEFEKRDENQLKSIQKNHSKIAKLNEPKSVSKKKIKTKITENIFIIQI